MTKKILIAKILSAHGIKGESKIIFFGDDLKNLEKYPLFDEKNRTYKIKILNKSKVANSTNKSGDKVCLVRVDGVVDRNQAELLAGTELFTLRENFSKTKKNEFYISDLIGLDVLNNSEQKIGKVINVLHYSHNCSIEIEFIDNFIPNGLQKVDNIPFKNDFFPIVETEKGFLILEIPEVVSSDLK